MAALMRLRVGWIGKGFWALINARERNSCTTAVGDGTTGFGIVTQFGRSLRYAEKDASLNMEWVWLRLRLNTRRRRRPVYEERRAFVSDIG